MTPGYLFRLYASPWKLGAWLLLSAVFVVVAYAVLSRPGSQLDFWHALAFWAFGIIFGLGVVAFGVQFVVFGVAPPYAGDHTRGVDLPSFSVFGERLAHCVE